MCRAPHKKWMDEVLTKRIKLSPLYIYDPVVAHAFCHYMRFCRGISSATRNMCNVCTRMRPLFVGGLGVLLVMLRQ